MTSRHYPARVKNMGDRVNVVLAACVLYCGVLMTRLEPPPAGNREPEKGGADPVRLQAGQESRDH